MPLFGRSDFLNLDSALPARRLTQDDVRRMALALPDAHEGAHMGHADLRVGNKVFASLPNDAGTVAIKISPLGLDALVRSDPETFRNAWGGRWIGVTLARVSRLVLRDLLHDAWRMTVPRLKAPKARAGGAAGAVARPSAGGRAARNRAGKSPER